MRLFIALVLRSRRARAPPSRLLRSPGTRRSQRASAGTVSGPSSGGVKTTRASAGARRARQIVREVTVRALAAPDLHEVVAGARSEEHTSELQSHSDIVCRLLLE